MTLLVARENTLWVLCKPSGVVVHAASEADAGRDVLSLAREQLGAPETLAAVHRLDRETSGVLLCSSDPAERATLSAIFASSEVVKRYLALVFGRTRDKGIIRRALDDGRRGHPLEAVTRYRTRERLGGFSLLEVRPETGRKHQIRRHLTAIGHAVVGDSRYKPRRFRPVPGYVDRLWLHAAAIALPDGRRFEAPLPGELAAQLEHLRTGAAREPPA
ncbi:MAG: RNA pseudouridine synthase [Myxococcales bacterium]|nr:RNA pseudouridine synthase [Myxococcales bacterium]